MTRSLERIFDDHTSGYAENGPEKRRTRDVFVQTVQASLCGRPSSIFSLPGQKAFCVKQFRDCWPETRIVCIDKFALIARITRAHGYKRHIGSRVLDNEIFSVTMTKYAMRRPPLCRFVNGRKRFISNFDFPKFDAMFLDTTNRFDNKYEMDAIIQMANEHSSEHAVVATTIVAGRPSERERSGYQIASMLESRMENLKLKDVIDYDTPEPMTFCVFVKGATNG